MALASFIRVWQSASMIQSLIQSPGLLVPNIPATCSAVLDGFFVIKPYLLILFNQFFVVHRAKPFVGRYNSGDIEEPREHESKGRQDPGCKEAPFCPTKILTLFSNKIFNVSIFKETSLK